MLCFKTMTFTFSFTLTWLHLFISLSRRNMTSIQSPRTETSVNLEEVKQRILTVSSIRQTSSSIQRVQLSPNSSFNLCSNETEMLCPICSMNVIFYNTVHKSCFIFSVQFSFEFDIHQELFQTNAAILNPPIHLTSIWNLLSLLREF